MTWHSFGMHPMYANLRYDLPIPAIALYPDAPEIPILTRRQEEKYDVIIVGAGPAGLFLNLLLARFGITSRLCIDSALGPVQKGHADGIMVRTVEILQTLGLADEIIRQAKMAYNATVWKGSNGNGMSRSSEPGFPPKQLWDTSRYEFFCALLHQGWMIRILEEDLQKRSPGNGVRYGTTLRNVSIDAEKDGEYPVAAEIAIATPGSEARIVKAKYIIGADGAHSVVRKSLGIKMEGEATDDLYGVVDIVADTNFPDIRKISDVDDGKGRMLIIPREETEAGWLTRFYVPFSHSVASAEVGEEGVETSQWDAAEKEEREARMIGLTQEKTIEKVAEMLKPYRFKMKEGTEVEWFTKYQVGRRVAERNAEKDGKGRYRAFLIGDACHTHSPKEGQGMNVSMCDALDLSWKLANVLNGTSADPESLFSSFAIERYQIACRLIAMDKKWYAHKYLRHLQQRNGAELPPEVIGLEIWNFVLGLNIQYDPDYLIDNPAEGVIKSNNYSAGVLHEGRRLADHVLQRYADLNPIHVQDAVAINGKFHIILFATRSFKERSSLSFTTLEKMNTEIAPRYPEGTLQGVIIVPGVGVEQSVDWSVLPEDVQKRVEMMTFWGSDEAYAFYGIDPEEGATVVVRPDQFVGSIMGLGDVEKLKAYLDRVVVRV